MELKVKITGPAGAGKSRLLDWLEHAIDGHAEYEVTQRFGIHHYLVVERIPSPYGHSKLEREA